MVFIIGIDLAVVAIGIIAAAMFAGLANDKGYVASQARKYVIVVCCAALFLMMMGQSLVNFIANLVQAKSGGFADAIIYSWSVFVFVVCIAVLYKAYKNMKVAPNAGTKVNSEEE